MNKNELQTGATARILGVHPETVRRYVKEGKLHPTKRLGRWRFNLRDVQLLKRFGPPSGRVCDVARALGVHRNTVLAWEAKGRIHIAKRTAGGRRFRRDDIVELVTEMSRKARENVGTKVPDCARSVGAQGGFSSGHRPRKHPNEN